MKLHRQSGFASKKCDKSTPPAEVEAQDGIISVEITVWFAGDSDNKNIEGDDREREIFIHARLLCSADSAYKRITPLVVQTLRRGKSEEALTRA